MGYLIAIAVLVIFTSYFIIKNARESANRSSGPDISDPSSAPDSIGDRDSESAPDDGGE